jgi:hypothetical protein
VILKPPPRHVIIPTDKICGIILYMNIKKQHYVIAGITLAVLILLAVWYVVGSGTKNVTQKVSTEEPIDVVMDFFGPWHKAVLSEGIDPYTEGLAESPILSKELRARLEEARNTAEIDVVLCQTVTPSKLASRMVYEHDDAVQILVFSREPRQPGQSVVTLARLNDGWYIQDITCAQETADAVGEYTFEASGALLKENVPLSYDTSMWHLGYVEDGVLVKVIPIILTAESVCIGAQDVETTCTTDLFDETVQVRIEGDMVEAGVLVKRLTFLQ